MRKISFILIIASVILFVSKLTAQVVLKDSVSITATIGGTTTGQWVDTTLTSQVLGKAVPDDESESKQLMNKVIMLDHILSDITTDANTITLYSGSGGTTVGGVPVPTVSKNSGWNIISGTQWIRPYRPANGVTISFVVNFTLPAGATNPILTVNVLADDQVTVFLNGNQVGPSPLAPAVYPASAASPFRRVQTASASAPSFTCNTGATPNVLRFDVTQVFGADFGLDYFATVTYREGLDHFLVTVEPDTINHGERATVHAQAKDANNADFTIPDETLIDFSLDANGELYGNFIAPDGSQAKSLAGVIYGDANSGKVKYIANGEKPDSTQQVTLTVKKSDDESKNGDGFVVVKPKYEFKLDILEPKETRPTLPDDQGGNPNDRNLIGSFVTLYKNDDPVANHNVTVTARMILPSGGHDHTIQPPLNTRGVFSTVALNPETGNGTITTQTDTDGIILLNYKAPVFSGKMEFTAQTTVDSDTIVARDTLTVKVRNLVHLPDSPANYIKIGGTCNHYGPSDDDDVPDNCQTRDNNHWGHDRAVAFLPFTAIQYRTRFPDDEILQINDISLPFGGKFDIWGQWVGNDDHEYHRLGLDVDVRSSTIPVGDDGYTDTNGNGQFDPGEPVINDVNDNGVYDRNREEFKDICRNNGVYFVDLEVDPPHFHVYFWDPPDD